MDQSKNKTMWSAVAGLFDPELRKLAQELAALVPESSALRSEAVERAIGSLKGLIEARAEKFSPVAGTAVEKATDFHDLFMGALGSRPELNLDKWAREVLTEAGARLKNAQDPAAEMERIKLEFKLRKELADMIRKEIPPPSPPPDPVAAINAVTDRLDTFNKKLESYLPRMKRWAENKKE